MSLEKRILPMLDKIGRDTINWYERFSLPKKGYDPDLGELIKSSWDYIDRGGKRFRPSLLVLTCEAFGGNYHLALPAAAAIESAHSFLLIHDDIEDDSFVRRGKTTLHRIYGSDVAINAGDYLSFKTWRCLSIGRDGWDSHPGWGCGKYSLITDLMAEMFERTGEGQSLDIWLRKQPLRETTYERVNKILTLKTGYYTSGIPMSIGAVIADRKEKIDQMKEIGLDIGVGFQIMDDVLNVMMTEKEAAVAPTTKGGNYGKDFMGDADEGKRTLLVVHLMENVSDKDRKKFEKMWGRKVPPLTVEEKKQLQGLYQKYGTIDYCKRVAMDKLRGVDERIKEAIPPSEKRERLLDLLRFYIERTF